MARCQDTRIFVNVWLLTYWFKASYCILEDSSFNNCNDPTEIHFNPFSTNVPLLYPLKTSENLWFSDVFKGYRSGTLVENGLINFSPVAYPAGIYLLKVNTRNTRKRCEICSKLTTKIPERRHWRRSGIFIVNFEHISHLVLVFLLLTLNI